jgi:predicted MFS family arabinose efflux permease
MDFAKERRERLILSGWFFALNIILFCIFANLALFYLYPLALEEMGATNTQVGLVMGIFVFSTVLTRPLFGVVTARIGEKRTMLLGISICLVLTLCYHFIERLSFWLYLVRFLHGLGFSAFIASYFSAVARLAPEGRRGEVFGVIGAMIQAAIALFPAVGEWLIKSSGFAALYNLAAAALFVALLAFIPKGFWRHKVYEPAENSGTAYLRLLRRPGFTSLLGVTLLFVFGVAAVFYFVALHTKHKGLSVGPFILVCSGLAVVIRITLGHKVDQRAKIDFVKWCFISEAAALFLMPFIHIGVIYYLAAFLMGLGISLMYPALNSLAAQQAVAEEEMPSLMAIYTMIFDFGFLVGTTGTGALADLITLDGVYPVMGLLALTGLLFIHLARRLVEPGSTR